MKSPEQPEPVDGYEPFFGLREAPFSLAPDPRFLFASASHSAALTQVAYALQRREPLVVVTGDIGTGKTLLCRIVLQRLPGKTFLSVISDPLLERDELLKQMLQDFGVISKDRTRLTATSRHDLVEALHAFLSSLVPLQAHAVVIIDEAQHLQPDVLEQIRLLSNVDARGGTTLEIILVGQTDLEQLLARPELRQLHQRVSRWLRLTALNRDEVEQYVKHRIELARNTKPLVSILGGTEFTWDLIESPATKEGVEFTPEAIDAVSQRSRGVPRVINLLCDRSLEQACASRLHVIDRRLIEAAARELGMGEPVATETPATLTVAAQSAEVGPAETWTLSELGLETDIAIAHPAVETRVDAVPTGLGALPPPTAVPRLAKYAALALLVVVAGVAIVFGIQNARPTAALRTPSPAASSATRTSGAQPQPARSDASALAPKTAATPGTPSPSATAAPAATGEQFDLVIASFRTDARALSVAAEVEALGLPVRRRVSDGWQQVVSGPFPSRADAEAAQERLAAAGLSGTQIALAAR